MALTVTAELIQVRDEATGASHQLAKGAPVPSFVKGDDLKHLKDLGFVGEPSKDDEGDSPKSSAASKSSK